MLVTSQTVILREPADHTAAVLAFIGALAVAVIAAWTASSRQRQQLRAEGERQQRQLVHDRQLADLDDLRRVLDDAALALDRASQAHRPVGARVLTDPIDHEGLAESHQEIGTARETCDALLARLRVRLGQNDPVSKAFAQATDALHKIEASTIFVSNAPDAEKREWVRREHFSQADRKFREGIDAFLDAAAQRAGTATRDEAQGHAASAPAGPDVPSGREPDRYVGGCVGWVCKT